METKKAPTSPQKTSTSRSEKMPLLSEIDKESEDYNNGNIPPNGAQLSPVLMQNEGLGDIHNFYKNQYVLIVGVSTFIGKVLLAKLLYHFPEIEQIYLLLELEDDESVHSKIADVLSDRIFTYTNFRNLDIEKKITGIKLSYMHLSEKCEQTLLKVSIIFNVSAPYAGGRNFQMFNDRSNVTFLCNISQKMKNLKSFVHLSTALLPNIVTQVQEEFYDISPIKQFYTDQERPFFHRVDIRHRCYENSFILKKVMSEEIIRHWSRSNNNLPVGIFRSGIMTATADEPVVGYVSDFHGINGITAAISSGNLNIMFGDPRLLINVVPVDKVAFALITSAWDIAMQKNRRSQNILIYNYVSTEDAPISWGEFTQHVVKYSRKYPNLLAVWYCTFAFTRRNWYFSLCNIFYYWIPAVSRDFCTFLIRRQSRAVCELSQQRRLMESHMYITSNEWRYKDSNVKAMWNRMSASDQNTFNFNMQDFNWGLYLLEHVCGVRTYLHRDSLETLEESRIRYRRLFWLHYFAKGVTLASLGLVGFLACRKISPNCRSIFTLLSRAIFSVERRLGNNMIVSYLFNF